MDGETLCFTDRPSVNHIDYRRDSQTRLFLFHRFPPPPTKGTSLRAQISSLSFQFIPIPSWSWQTKRTHDEEKTHPEVKEEFESVIDYLFYSSRYTRTTTARYVFELEVCLIWIMILKLLRYDNDKYVIYTYIWGDEDFGDKLWSNMVYSAIVSWTCPPRQNW